MVFIGSMVVKLGLDTFVWKLKALCDTIWGYTKPTTCLSIYLLLGFLTPNNSYN